MVRSADGLIGVVGNDLPALGAGAGVRVALLVGDAARALPASLFAGILNRSSATIINIGASMWVMDPAVQTVANTIPLPDYVLDKIRSNTDSGERSLRANPNGMPLGVSYSAGVGREEYSNEKDEFAA